MKHIPLTLLTKQTRPRQSLCLSRRLSFPSQARPTTHKPRAKTVRCTAAATVAAAGQDATTCVREYFMRPSHLLHTQGAGESLVPPPPLHYCGPHSQRATSKMAKGAVLGRCRATAPPHTTQARPRAASRPPYPAHATVTSATGWKGNLAKKQMPQPKRAVHTTEL